MPSTWTLKVEHLESRAHPPFRYSLRRLLPAMWLASCWVLNFFIDQSNQLHDARWPHNSKGQQVVWLKLKFLFSFIPQHSHHSYDRLHAKNPKLKYLTIVFSSHLHDPICLIQRLYCRAVLTHSFLPSFLSTEVAAVYVPPCAWQHQ